MTQPAQPTDHPAPEDTPKGADDNPTGLTPNGVPPDADTEATAVPDTGRQLAEAAAHPDKHDG